MTNRALAGGCAGSNYPFLTSKERDNETELDFAQARYYSSKQGRFTSPDQPFLDQWEGNPQSWNLYSYVRNNPLRLVDPTGNTAEDKCNEICKKSREEAERLRKEAEEEGMQIVVTDSEPAQVTHIIEMFNPDRYSFDPPMGGGLRNVTKMAARAGLFSRIANWFGFGRKAGAGKLVGSLDGLTQAERSMVQELLAGGRTVQIIPRATGRTADFIIDGAVTELKTLQSAGPTTVKNAIQAASKQGQHILIDARNVSLTPSEAAQQIQRAQGNIGGLQGRVTVLTKDGPVKF